MKALSRKEVLAYVALVLSFLPASSAVFGILFLGLDLIDENLYTTADATKMLALTTGSAIVAFWLIWKAAKQFSKPVHR